MSMRYNIFSGLRGYLFYHNGFFFQKTVENVVVVVRYDSFIFNVGELLRCGRACRYTMFSDLLESIALLSPHRYSPSPR